ncbi:hypothetical protein [Nevskia ramosa]|uniref:hypothetical protein n=1 Tax=Nevskia ramosa TaxID=64002 RepID=UPI0012EC1429|nr:hypothetical protein [Nevskia ramosa]
MTASEQAKADIRTTALHKFFTGNRRQIESWIVANGRQGIVALQLRDHQPAQGAGGEKVFWLERAAVPTTDTAPTPTPETDIGANVHESSPLPEQHLVDYQMSYCSGPDLSAWGRFIFRDGRLRRGHWRWKLLAARVLISVFGAGAAVVIALLIALTTKSGDISLKLAFEAAIFAVFLYFKARAWHQTIEDRLRSAPDELISHGNPTQLEIVGVGPQAEWRIVRYTSTCTVCSGEVQIRPGEPDFPRRMVGRCAQSPREHVFSFDRITLIGGPLIIPPTRRMKEAGEVSAEQDVEMGPPVAGPSIL